LLDLRVAIIQGRRKSQFRQRIEAGARSLRREIHEARHRHRTDGEYLPGTDPFGAVVVKDGVIIGEGPSAMRANSDATAHGEILAIRAANKKLSTPDLSGCVFYTSCEPCPLCVAAIAIARLDKVFYAATLKESAAAFSVLPPGGRFGVDVPKIIAEEHATIDTRQLPAQQEMAAEAVEVMKRWAIQRRDALLK